MGEKKILDQEGTNQARLSINPKKTVSLKGNERKSFIHHESFVEVDCIF